MSHQIILIHNQIWRPLGHLLLFWISFLTSVSVHAQSLILEVHNRPNLMEKEKSRSSDVYELWETPQLRVRDNSYRKRSRKVIFKKAQEFQERRIINSTEKWLLNERLFVPGTAVKWFTHRYVIFHNCT